jgi:hypothetical protein
VSQNLDGMVVVAAGKSSSVKRWAEALRKAAIQYAVAHRHYDDPSAPTDHAEIWVESDDVEKARTVIRDGKAEDKPPIA